MAKTACGAHKELGVASGMRITQCGCGAVHLHLRGGVSVRLAAREFGELAEAVASARRALAQPDDEGAGEPRKPAVN